MIVLRSVRLRLTFWYVVLLAIILAGFSTGVYVVLRQNLHDNLDDSIRNRADVLLNVVRHEDGSPTLADRVSTNDPNAEESFVRVFDASGGVTFDNTTAEAYVSIDSPAVDRALRGEASTRTVTVDGDAMRVRGAAAPVTPALAT